MGIKAAYYSRVSSQSVWEQAQSPKSLLTEEFKLLIDASTTPPSEPLHHVIFAQDTKTE